MTTSMTNEVAFEALLDDIKRASNDVQRDAGTRFETLIKDWLTQEETYRDLFAKVETFKEWAASHPNLSSNSKDIGIDLVATLAENPDHFAAIQCKFYEKDSSVQKKEIDSFIAASNRSCFVQRYIVATNEKWSENAITEMQCVTPPITLITRSLLASSQIDWATYLKTGQVVQQKKRTPRKYQEEAIQNVLSGFQSHNRGKLIMACGTGKTFTSMKIAEKMEGDNGFVMFLVPSLALLSQTLTDWKRQCSVPIHAFAVCSDTTTGKPDLANVDEITSASDLCYPATTKADKLADEIKKARAESGMTVIFSTYQSIDVVSEAQHKFGMEEIGLIVCDEAHRTAGGHYQDEGDAPFQRIHSDEFIKGRKRLYMTATPRIYGEVVKEQKEKGEVVLYSMDDEDIYGPTFHTITFSQAVGLGSLVDYKVIVLSVEEDVLESRALSDYELVQSGGLSVKNAAKVVGCWRALSKIDLQSEVSMSDDRHPMRRAVGFAQIIEPNMRYLDRTSSKRFTDKFEATIEEFKDQQYKKLSAKNKALSKEAYDLQNPLKCETRHIDGSMNSTEKDALLNWLREDPEDNICKILFNVRCLSEGVDVPALDAVLFLSPRKSQVEVVQTVGRVMRVSPQTGKKRGYVIIPIVTPAGLDPSIALNNNADFDVVWQVLNALKSIDTEFGAIVDGQRNIIDSSKIEVVCITNKMNRKGTRKGGSGGGTKPPVQGTLDFNHDNILEDEIRARIVKRVGNRREWGDWAEDVGKICKMQIEHINDVLNDPTKTKSRLAFESFKKELQATLNGNLTNEEIIEMLGQHVVTQPILDALFTVKNGDEIIYEFSKQNPIATAMTAMMDSLDKESMKLATKSLEDFYRSVRSRTRTIKTAADRQLLIKELFEKFFKAAFPKQQEKLGIVYTPIEIVDFINQSVADLLKKEFNCNIGDDGIHVLDPFSGTGTFIARLMQSGLIPRERLPSKFEHELHANEIVPLAYYVASMNLEGVFHELCPNEVYRPNKVMIWTDTFANNRQSDVFSTTLGENNARLAELNKQDIRVIVGNPPYSVGQESANDDNQNEHYEELDARLAATYVQETSSNNKNKLYDSYIRAYRWASDRIGNQGVIGFVTNAGWLETSSADGMRKCMTEEFNSIYVYHLKGNQRTSGERSRQEGGKVFGEGSRAPVAIVFLVKNPESSEQGKIYFHSVGDYLTREEKLETLKKDRSISYTPMNVIVPDDHGDWFNQRDDSFSHFMRMDGKKTKEISIFNDYSLGVNTNRDVWVYNSSRKVISNNVNRSISAFNQAVNEYDAEFDIAIVKQKYIKDVAWSSSLESRLKRRIHSNFSKDRIRESIYRPFIKQYLYFDNENGFTHRPGRWKYIFPTNETKNLTICSSGVDKANNLIICVNQNSKDAGQIALMTNHIADLHFNGDTQCFPRWLPGENVVKKDSLDLGDSNEIPSGFSKEALPHFQEAYPGKAMTEDDLFYYIYGLLHSEDYRTRYANNLMKELPRIPRVATYEQFMAFTQAGRNLADLHVNFENVEPYSGVTIEFNKDGAPSYRVTQMKWGKIKGKTGNAAKDKSTLIYNDWITVKNVPLEAQEYVVNKKSALDWVVERACVSIDKASGIENDFNDYAAEQGNERYPLELFLKVITVSLETIKIVKNLPPLEIHTLDKDTQ